MDAENRFTCDPQCACNTGLKDAVFCKGCGCVQAVTFSSPFYVFGLEEDYFVEDKHVHRAYLDLQNKLHPDRFVFKNQERHLAELHAGFLNWAYQILKDPIKRADYLLRDVPDDFPPEQLMEQMEKREHLEQLSDLVELQHLKRDLEAEMDEIQKQMSAAFQRQDTLNAKYTLLKIKYLQRFKESLVLKMKGY